MDFFVLHEFVGNYECEPTFWVRLHTKLLMRCMHLLNYAYYSNSNKLRNKGPFLFDVTYFEVEKGGCKILTRMICDDEMEKGSVCT